MVDCAWLSGLHWLSFTGDSICVVFRLENRNAGQEEHSVPVLDTFLRLRRPEHNILFGCSISGWPTNCHVTREPFPRGTSELRLTTASLPKIGAQVQLRIELPRMPEPLLVTDEVSRDGWAFENLLSGTSCKFVAAATAVVGTNEWTGARLVSPSTRH